MTIDELSKKGLLKKVDVKRPSEDVIEVGNLKSKVKFQNPMCGFTCAGNSQCVVEAMIEKGEKDWYIVPGFAFDFEKKKEENSLHNHLAIKELQMKYIFFRMNLLPNQSLHLTASKKKEDSLQTAANSVNYKKNIDSNVVLY